MDLGKLVRGINCCVETARVEMELGLLLGSGCSKCGKAVASNTTDPLFEMTKLKILKSQCLTNGLILLFISIYVPTYKGTQSQ